MYLTTRNWKVKNKVIICLVVFIGIIFFLQLACQRVLPEEIPSLVTVNVTDITSASLTSGGLIFSSGGDPVLSRGICLSTERNPTISDTKTGDGTGKGSFTSSISGLMAGTTYYIRAYATNSIGTGYGNQYVIATTGELISVISLTTTAISSITSSSAVGGGNIISDGGSAVIDRGVCWSTSPGPTTANSITSDGTGTGIFTSAITALTPGITYYVRAYATNNAGTFYGNEVNFKTICNGPAPPGPITGNTNVAPNATGVAYFISAIPGAIGYTWTVPAGATITSGQGTTSIIVNFGTNGGNVSVRSENSCGISKYTDLYITTTSISNCGTVTDIDGNVYNTVTIGTQCWMEENLKTTKYRNGDPILTETDDEIWSSLTAGAYCWYNNDAATYQALYGALYNWYSVADSRNLCPAGWHVPSDAEWTTLENYLLANGYNYDGSTTDNKYAKSLASSTGWNFYPTAGAAGNTDYPAKRNATGFTALPGGVRDANEKMFGSVGNFAIWWSASEGSSTTAWDRGVDYRYVSLGRYNVNKSSGFSVRCVKDF
jgi:uncharacterized protein (TIGR02145 family)